MIRIYKKTILIALLSTIVGLSNNAKAQTVTDIDGNTYNTVTIGNQVWMQENLTVTKYSNGDPIGTTTPDTLDISLETSPKYQWRPENNDSLLAIYGRWYTWYTAADSRNVCPTGWHVPTDAEWTTLTNFLGGNLDSVGGPLKEVGTTHWISPNTGADNSSGFTALPGGGREPYSWIGLTGCFWTSTLYFSTYAKYRRISNDETEVYAGGTNMYYGYSIRCMEGVTVGIENNINNPSFGLYPNPSNGKFKIEIADIAANKIGIEIYNMLGELVLQRQTPALSGVERTSYIDLSSAPKGIYFVNIYEGDKMYNQKIVIQ